MNKEELTQRIIDPKSIEKSDLVELKNLANKYSYSPIFSMLLLSGLSKHHDFSFEEELSNHAYRIPDRIRLFNLTHDIQTSVDKEVENHSNKLTKTTDVEISSVSTEYVKEETTTEIEEEKPDIPEKKAEDQTPINSTIDEESEIESTDNTPLELEKEVIELDQPKEEEDTPILELDHKEDLAEADEKEVTDLESTTQEENTSQNSLDVDIYAAAVSRSIEQEVSPETKDNIEKTEEVEVEEEYAKTEDVLAEETPSETPEEVEKNAVNADPIPHENTEVKDTENHTDFFSWLASKTEVSETKDTQSLKEDQIENKVEIQSNIETTEKTVNSTEIEDTKEEKSKVNSIIEKFITEEPHISRPKKEFFSPSKVAKKSLDESSLPVSETLAQIFAAQGNYPKAIASYEQLMLKFPEKKSFFANQIKKLKQKLIK